MRGVVYDGKEARVTDGLTVRSPGANEVLVRIAAAGLCHSDVSVVNGTIPWPSPSVLGHEGAGIVEEVGSAVTRVKPGDRVVVATIANCGFCPQCAAGPSLSVPGLAGQPLAALRAGRRAGLQLRRHVVLCRGHAGA